MAAKAKAVAKAKAKPTEDTNASLVELKVASAFVGFDDKPRTPLWCQENGSIPETAVCGLASTIRTCLESTWCSHTTVWVSAFLCWIH